jgi:hypothetical protein
MERMKFIDLLPLLKTTSYSTTTYHPTNYLGQHHHGTTSWVDSTIHFPCNGCSMENSWAWIKLMFVCQWAPKSAMVELDKIYVCFYKTPKKNQLLFMLPSNNTFIIEEKLCACKFLFETTMCNSD